MLPDRLPKCSLSSLNWALSEKDGSHAKNHIDESLPADCPSKSKQMAYQQLSGWRPSIEVLLRRSTREDEQIGEAQSQLEQLTNEAVKPGIKNKICKIYFIIFSLNSFETFFTARSSSWTKCCCLVVKFGDSQT